MCSAPVRPMQNMFKTPKRRKQESRYPPFDLPNTQPDNKPRAAWKAVIVRVDPVVKKGVGVGGLIAGSAR